MFIRSSDDVYKKEVLIATGFLYVLLFDTKKEADCKWRSYCLATNIEREYDFDVRVIRYVRTRRYAAAHHDQVHIYQNIYREFFHALKV